MRRLLKAFAALTLLLALAAAATAWWSRHWLTAPIAALRQPYSFEVPSGATLRAVAMSLEQQGLIARPQLWIAWARLTGRADGLKAGEYELKPGLTPQSLLALLSSGKVLLHSITFVEGTTFAELRATLAANSAIDGTYASRSDAEIMRALGEPSLHPEGQFFPDTYHFPRGTTDLAVLALAHRRMQAELEAAWQSRSADLPLASAYEALILASIVEKETALEPERALIAGVFIERLRHGMRLQTDPTVIYGMLERYDGNIRRADLSRDTPYNTYTRPGLPPTPIAMPGLASLRAAVRPQANGALFFVATGAGDGSHHFSRTLAEHNLAVKRYLKVLRQR